MSYNSYQLNDAQKSVLKNCPKQKRILTQKYISFLKNQTDTIVYLSLKDHTNCWVLIKSCDEKQLSGYIKINQNWVYRTILLSDIIEFC